MNMKRTGIHLAKAMAVSILLSALLLLLMAFVLYKGNFSGLVENILVIIIYLAASFAGGFLLGKQEGKRRYLWGAVFGGCYFLLLLLLSRILPEGGEGVRQTAELSEKLRALMICVLGGMVGGMVS